MTIYSEIKEPFEKRYLEQYFPSSISTLDKNSMDNQFILKGFQDEPIFGRHQRPLQKFLLNTPSLDNALFEENLLRKNLLWGNS